MEASIASAVALFVRSGSQMNVAATCRELQISRKTFYKYVDRFRSQGVEGFYPQSRRPLASPGRLPPDLEDVLVRLRKQEAEAGWDYGADAVLLRLAEGREELWPPGRELPSRSTLNRVFEARGLLTRTPQRRPRRVHRRFERDHVNALWQYDGFGYRLADGQTVVVLHLTDDCSRTDLVLHAARSENGPDVWAAFCIGVERYGLPAQLLTDNGTAFSGRRRGWLSSFERRLALLDVLTLTARVAHPQTCGKNERAHQRVQKWLARRPPAQTMAGLQALLDEYRAGYNSRGNQVLRGLSPNERFALGPTAYPTALQQRTIVSHHVVSSRGAIGLDGHLIGVGRRYSGQAAEVFRTADQIAVFIDDDLVRELVLDRSRRYQPQDR